MINEFFQNGVTDWKRLCRKFEGEDSTCIRCGEEFGSHCIEALARSGIGHLILVDNDTVSLTNINRQSVAYHSTIGQYEDEGR